MMISKSQNKHRRVLVIGGGITGLSTCWHLQTQAARPPEVTLLESAPNLGGKMTTAYLRDENGTFIIDAGPESFVTRKPEAWNLALELGLEDQLTDPGSETRNMYVLDGGEPKEIPLSPGDFIFSDLISFPGKLRMLMEPFIPARKDGKDESLAEFVSRRLGKKALTKMVGPVLAGIYNTDPKTQSILTTSPIMREMEREHGSIFLGALARMRAKKRDTNPEPSRPRFMAFKDGAQVMIDALDDQLNTRILKETQAVSLSKHREGYQIRLSGGSTLSADAVVLATPANQASRLLSEDFPRSARLTGQIDHENIGTATLIFTGKDFQLPYQINGLMIPRREEPRIDALTWTTNKALKRAPEGYEMVRVFFGGSDPSLVEMQEDRVIEIILQELHTIFGIHPVPYKTAVFRWPSSFPQAYVGHLELVGRIENSLPPGVFTAGSSYRGIGVPDCIRQGRDAADHVLSYLSSSTQ